jgi:phage-related minor tail protein
MTSYFSVQIKELDGVYTVKTYWVTFAVIMVLSFVALFMFSRVLVGVGTAVAKQVDKVVARVKGRVAHRDSPTGAQNWIRTGESS